VAGHSTWSIGDYLAFGHVGPFVSFGGGRAAWVYRQRNESAVYYLDYAVSTEPVRVVELPEGVDIYNAKVESGILYIYTANPFGLNPSQSVDGPPGGMVYSWDGASLVEVGDIPLGATSAGGVVYAQGPVVVEMNPEGEESMLFAVLEGATHFAWSPDQTTLAFSYTRGDHAFIGLYRRGAKTLEYAGTSTDTDSHPVWSPDGTKIAFLRTRPIYDHNRILKIQGYQIMVYDTIHKTTKQIYKDWHSGQPFTYGTYPTRMYWANEDLLIYITERTGWLRLFSISISTYRFTYLTPDGCESPDYRLEDGRLYSINNCDHLNSRGIYLIDPISGDWEVLVPGRIGTVSGMMGGVATLPDGILYLESTAKHSTRINKISAPGSPPVCYFNCNEDYKVPLVTPALASFRSIDNEFDIYLQVFAPKPSHKPSPVIIYTHGGSRDQFFPAFHPYYPYARIYSELQYYASQGFLVVSINYRSGVGQGKKFRDCKSCCEFGGREYRDILGTVSWLKTLPHHKVDMDRIGITGLSYGGLNTLHALARNSNVFKAGVSFAGVWNMISAMRHDGELSYSYSPMMPYGVEGPEPSFLTPHWFDTVNSNLRKAFNSSPIAYLSGLRSPLLVIQGDQDPAVAIQEAIAIVSTLRDLGRPVETHIVPSEGHVFAGWENYVTAAEKGFMFLRKHL